MREVDGAHRPLVLRHVLVQNNGPARDALPRSQRALLALKRSVPLWVSSCSAAGGTSISVKTTSSPQNLHFSARKSQTDSWIWAIERFTLTMQPRDAKVHGTVAYMHLASWCSIMSRVPRHEQGT
jgi:hypothetical protein